MQRSWSPPSGRKESYMIGFRSCSPILRRMENLPQAVPERRVERLLLACAGLPVLVTAALLAVLTAETAQLLRHVSPAEFLFGAVWAPAAADRRFGVLPLAAGTLLVAFVALAVALPAGLLTAIYLSEYAPPAMRRAVKPALTLLAGVPTVVYGYCALLFVTPALQRLLPGLEGVNALSSGMVVGVMLLPMVASLSEDALQAAPRELREAVYALGATRAQATLRVVVPAARAGIAAAVILSAARAIGETMIVAIAAGRRPSLTANPLEPVQTMTAYVAQAAHGGAPAGAPEHHALFAVGLLLFIGTYGLNLAGNWLRQRAREARA